ncbi:hypothetical protein ABW20_dc0102915 [Dactylellina cionopaga]|nr:hypothetical protein ABW20_dc0102915 [Dactylellina cionopaga]
MSSVIEDAIHDFEKAFERWDLIYRPLEPAYLRPYARCNFQDSVSSLSGSSYSGSRYSGSSISTLAATPTSTVTVTKDEYDNKHIRSREDIYYPENNKSRSINFSYPRPLKRVVVNTSSRSSYDDSKSYSGISGISYYFASESSGPTISISGITARSERRPRKEAWWGGVKEFAARLSRGPDGR